MLQWAKNAAVYDDAAISAIDVKTNPSVPPERRDDDFLELYCGNGNFTIPMSRNFRRVLATEVSKANTECARENLTANQVKNVQFARLNAKETADALQPDARPFKRLTEAGVDLSSLKQLTKAKIPFVTTLARNKVYKKTGKFEEVEQPEKEKKETENKDSVIATLKDQIAMLKQKLENEKNKAVKPEPNPETGEVPLTIGLANKLLKDKEMKKEDVQEADLTKPQIKKVHKMADELPKKDFKDRYGKEKGDAVRYATATNIVKKKLGIEENLGDIFMKKFAKKDNKADMMFKKLSQRAQTYVNELLRSGMGTMEAIQKAKDKFGEDMKNEEMRLRVEAIAGLKKKAEKSGMPYSILKKVFDRGMAAWKGGHRPGASQHQWAFARVNSFVTKSSGTWGGADKDLAKQVRGSK